MISHAWRVRIISRLPFEQSRYASQLARSFSSMSRRLSSFEIPKHLDEKEGYIFRKLAESLKPSKLDVRDVSGGCGSMYAVDIESPSFRGLNILKMHRKVQEVLADDIKTMHGIQLKTKATPSDAA